MIDNAIHNTTTPVAFVAEDDPGIAYLLKFLLTKEGYLVHLANDGEAASHYLHEQPAPDLVVLDVMLPKQDGLTLLSAIQRRPEWCDRPVIMLSAINEENTLAKAIELGATDYVSKPFDPMDLVMRIRRIKAGEAAHVRDARSTKHNAAP